MKGKCRANKDEIEGREKEALVSFLQAESSAGPWIAVALYLGRSPWSSTLFITERPCPDHAGLPQRRKVIVPRQLAHAKGVPQIYRANNHKPRTDRKSVV